MAHVRWRVHIAPRLWLPSKMEKTMRPLWSSLGLFRSRPLARLPQQQDISADSLPGGLPMSEVSAIRTFLPETEFFGVSPVMIVDEGRSTEVAVSSIDRLQSSMRSTTTSLTPRIVCALRWHSQGLFRQASSKLNRSVLQWIIVIVVCSYGRGLML